MSEASLAQFYVDCKNVNRDAAFQFMKRLEWHQTLVLEYGLYHAASSSNLELVIDLWHKVEVHARMLDTILEWACIGGHVPIVEYVLQHGATNYRGALWNAAKMGHVNLVLRFIPLVPPWMTCALRYHTRASITILKLQSFLSQRSPRPYRCATRCCRCALVVHGIASSS
jgi:hypothetical protein